MNVNLDFWVVFARWPELLSGLAYTIILAFAGMALSLVIGILGVAIRRANERISSVIVSAFIEVIRNTPFLVQIFFLYFALPFLGIKLSQTFTAILALGLNGGAYAIEIIRGGVDSVPRGQWEAGYALGLKSRDIFRMVIIKPALRAIYPSLASQFILLTLNTAICTSISAFELTSVGQRIEDATFRSFEVYFTLTGIYLLLSLCVMSLLGFIGRSAFNYPTR
ncbi:amino acid ABC transporter permease (plasmid) [Agrobacterium sp. rho-13.3]|uniref:amino acid ABC transporter permease n=1 Tax=Agrobacterium sp. rho-13.3 TaxID=3072980 RepID=UPI002A0F1F15|nr:amino acid ABC transporter permease [Agrobacterium sp. rho-13.3]MDX8312040.1 amino acid ABC transporter permease [Agrobacterium sp. rho-13.3]